MERSVRNLIFFQVKHLPSCDGCRCGLSSDTLLLTSFLFLNDVQTTLTKMVSLNTNGLFLIIAYFWIIVLDSTTSFTRLRLIELVFQIRFFIFLSLVEWIYHFLPQNWKAKCLLLSDIFVRAFWSFHAREETKRYYTPICLLKAYHSIHYQ